MYKICVLECNNTIVRNKKKKKSNISELTNIWVKKKEIKWDRETFFTFPDSIKRNFHYCVKETADMPMRNYNLTSLMIKRTISLWFVRDAIENTHPRQHPTMIGHARGKNIRARCLSDIFRLDFLEIDIEHSTAMNITE